MTNNHYKVLMNMFWRKKLIMMTSIPMRILKDNEIVCADDNTNGDDFEDESDEEEEDSEKSVGVDDPSDDIRQHRRE